MIFTLKYAVDELAQYIDAGLPATSTVIVKKINEAIMSILMIEDWALTVQRMRFFVSGDTLVLPSCGERIVACRPDVSLASPMGRNAGHVWSKHYEFIEGGPLYANSDATGLRELVDLGDGYPTMYDIDRALSVKLVAFSTVVGDAGKLLHIRGATPGQRELLTAGANGISLAINQWKDGVEGDVDLDAMVVSSSLVSDISHVVKPVTTGYVSLFAIDETTKAMDFLALYHPAETVPGFHRYRVQNADTENGSAWTTLVKMRYVPAVDDNDPLLIQNIPALKSMLLALRENDQGNIQKKKEYTTDCMWWLGRQLKQSEPDRPVMQVSDNFETVDLGSN